MVTSSAATVGVYIAGLAPERRAEIEAVRAVINAALPAGYVEVMSYGMIGWVVPLLDYPDTYNGQPLSYAGLAAQKNAFSLYLNCVHVSTQRADRFRSAWAASGKKLDMGKSCIRFKRAETLALDEIRDEIAATTPAQFIAIYEATRPPAR